MSISKRNRRGLFTLLIVCIVISYLPRLFTSFSDSSIDVSFQEIEEAEEGILEKKEIKRRQSAKKTRGSKFRRPTQSFDPNQYSKEDWMKLGLSAKQSDVVLKFAERGIRSNDDLKKIFVLPQELFVLIKDSTVYPRNEYSNFRAEPMNNDPGEIEVVALNSATKEELMSLPGIGDYYAEKIIKYRDDLGGFYGKHQLLEIWKFDTERYDKIREYVHTDVSKVKKLNINRATIDELKVHPYIRYKVANSIVKMRKVHGDYSTPEELLRSDLIDEELLSKLKPYITL